MTELAPDSAAPCAGCGAPLKLGAAFCAQCGRRAAPVEPPRPGGLGLVLRFYVAMLAVQAAALIYARVTEQTFAPMVAATAGLALVTAAVALVHRELVGAAYARAGFGPRGYLLVLVAAPVILAVVLGYVHGLGAVFRVPVPRELDGLAGHGLGVAVLLIVIAPPLVEELAFRGVIYGALGRNLRPSEVFLISSFAFALLHLAIPSLLTHFPLGLYLCWLRHRSGSLWPPMFAHACHNLGALLVELNGWV